MLIDDFVDALASAGIRSGAGVPCSYFTPLVNRMAVDPGLRYVPAAQEGEAVAIAAGLTAAGRPAFALMQNSGLGNAVNPVTSLLHPYRIPVVLLVSHRGEPGVPDEPQHELMGQITTELATLCGLRTHALDPHRLADQLRASIADSAPTALICGKGSLEGGPTLPVVALRARSGTVTPESSGEFTAAATREEVLRSLLPLLNGGGAAPAVVSTTGKLSRELYELDDRDHSRANRFYMVGSMGCASAFGLGVATARPDLPVVVLDGDGALLMKLGSLATIGHAAPERLHHVVVDNGAHESTGGQPTASPTVDLASLALAAGYRRATTVSDPADAADALRAHLGTPGPSLLRVVVRGGSRADLGRPSLSPRDTYTRFADFVAGAG